MIQITIQAVPTRAIHANVLSKHLSNQGLNNTISYDEKYYGSWYNLRKILLNSNFNKEYTHHLVLQDDIILSENFKENVLTIANVMVGNFVTLFANRKEVKEASDKGNRWAKLNNFLGGQAVMFPTIRIMEFLKFTDTFKDGKTTKEFWKHDDVRLKAFLRENKETIYCSIPNLIEHNTFIKSAVGNSSRYPNKARVFYNNPGIIDWTLI